MNTKSNSFVDSVRRSLAASSSVRSATFVPTVLIERPPTLMSWKSAKGTSADWALAAFHSHGFRGDRTRNNLFGYPGLLRDLSDPPEWVHVAPEDLLCEMDEDRRSELRPLIVHIQELTEAALIAHHRAERRAAFVRQQLFEGRYIIIDDVKFETDAFREECFRELIGLGKVLGADLFYDIFDAVFEFDEFTPAEGAPDLLVWLPESEPSCWFFSEVKAPGDYLRDSQKAWLHQYWELVRGHYLITILE